MAYVPRHFAVKNGSGPGIECRRRSNAYPSFCIYKIEHNIKIIKRNECAEYYVSDLDTVIKVSTTNKQLEKTIHSPMVKTLL